MTPSSATSTSSPPAQDPAKLLFADLAGELKTTRLALERVPDGKNDWRPHQRSKTLDELATHIAQLPGLGIVILTRDIFEGGSAPPQAKPADSAARLKIFDEVAGEFQRLINELTWDRAMAPFTLTFRGQPVVEGQRAQIVRSVLITHAAHHRAQLGVYLRLLDLSVPSTYGPSADEAPARR
jgi:uncharacterized damage-inducible protein DinB